MFSMKKKKVGQEKGTQIEIATYDGMDGTSSQIMGDAMGVGEARLSRERAQESAHA